MSIDRDVLHAIEYTTKNQTTTQTAMRIYELEAEIECLQSEIDERNMSFDLQWKAQQRAIKRWQKATGQELVWPDTADLIVWLLEQLDSQQKAIDWMRKLAWKWKFTAEIEPKSELLSEVSVAVYEALALADGGDV